MKKLYELTTNTGILITMTQRPDKWFVVTANHEDTVLYLEPCELKADALNEFKRTTDAYGKKPRGVKWPWE